MNEGEFIHTPRLKLIPATSSLIQAELGQGAIFCQLLGAQIPENWPPECIVDALPYFLKQLEQNPELVGWFSWYWILMGKAGDESVLIGSGGFKDRPQPDGTVEVGYSVLPQHQGCGYTSEAVGGLLCWVFALGEVAQVIAETLPENRPSTRVLEKLGFDFVGHGSEPGTIRFELGRERYHT
ncbi:GNAT family N-acetyltransferase [Chloroflexota bacterium]